MNRNDILIVSALHKELPDLTINTNYSTIYTGVGKVNATYRLVDSILKYHVKVRDRDFGFPKIVINYGTAASKVHSGLVDCTKFIQRDMDATPMGFKIGETPFEKEPSMIDFSHIKNPIGKNLTCYTGDSFVTDIQYMDVVDMEAYALAKTCRNLEIDFVSYKYISDDGNADDWEKNCGKGIKEFKKLLNEIL